MIIVMDDSNYERVSRLAPERKYLDKLHRMVEFVTDYPDYSYIPDPYYEGAEGFYLVLNMLENGCGNLLDKLEKEL
jgi:protein-tyrosine phosphatase